MRDAYERGLSLASLAPSLILAEQIKEQQESIMAEDWRIGVVGKYVEDKQRVCILQIWTEALAPVQGKGKLTRKDSNDIAEILVHQLHWERHNVETFDDYGRQKAFHAPQDGLPEV